MELKEDSYTRVQRKIACLVEFTAVITLHTMSRLIILLFIKCYGDEIIEYEMDVLCSTHVIDGKYVQYFCRKTSLEEK